MILADGERRYNAYIELGHTTIPSRIIPGLTKENIHIIEFISNNERKEFTWHEELNLKHVMHKEWKASAKESGNTWGYRETAAKLKVSLGGLSTDLELAGAIVHFPELKAEASKNKAKERWKKLQQQAASIKSFSSLPKAEQENLKKMMTGQAPVIKDGKRPQKGGQDDAHGTNENSGCGDTDTPTDTTSGLLESPIDPTLPNFTYQVCGYKELLPDVPDNSVGFCELDPPYAIDFNNTYGKMTNITTSEDDWEVDKLMLEMEYLLKKLYKKLIDHSWVLCWTGKEHWLDINYLAELAGFSVQTPGIWAKPSGSSNSPSTNMISTYEMFLLFRKGKATFNVNSFNPIQECAPSPSSHRTHQWEKPMKLYNTFFSVLGKPGSLFLSLFAGSGASMVSATLNGMTPIGCDIRQKYFFSFVKMLKNHHYKGD